MLGESLASPRNALGDDARAAALITQDDLVTSFREIGRLDPSVAATEISSKLNSFSNVDDIKTNYRDIYKATIQAQADAEGGIIAGLDSFLRTVSTSMDVCQFHTRKLSKHIFRKTYFQRKTLSFSKNFFR